MESDIKSHEYYPVLVSRRGELIAWASTLVVSLAWLVLSRSGEPIPFAVPLMVALLLLAALSISLGNWMDRQTSITMDSERITFRNGLRNVQIRWNKIKQVRVLPSNWGEKIQVIGERSHFEFRTLGEIKVHGEVKGRMGFSEGGVILDRILTSANLKPVGRLSQENTAQKQNPHYYERE